MTMKLEANIEAVILRQSGDGVSVGKRRWMGRGNKPVQLQINVSTRSGFCVATSIWTVPQ